MLQSQSFVIYTVCVLFACRFEAAELGRPMPATEFQDTLTELYGDPALRSKALVQSAEQLQLQAAAAAGAAGKQAHPAAGDQAAAAAAPLNGRSTALDALASRIMPAGAAAATSMPPRAAAGGGAAAQRRVAPMPVGAGAAAGPSGRAMEPPPAKRQNTGAGAAASAAANGMSTQLGPSGAAAQPGAAATAAGAGAVGKAVRTVLAEPVLRNVVSVQIGEYEDPQQPGTRHPVQLEACNTGEWKVQHTPGTPCDLRCQSLVWRAAA